MIWMLYAFLSALSTSMVSIFAKLGVRNINPLMAVTIQSCVMAIFFIVLSLITKNHTNFSLSSLKSCDGLCVIGAGIMMSLAVLFYFTALTTGHTYKVTAIDRMSFAIVIVLSAIFLGETVSIKTAVGTVITFAGIIIIALSQ